MVRKIPWILAALSWIGLSCGKPDQALPGFVPDDDWFERQRAFPFDEIPQDAYLKALDHVRTRMTSAGGHPLRDVVWTLAGPSNIEGRITTIAMHPTDENIVYAGSANGGLWKSTDYCQSWFSIFDHQNTTSIGAIAIDPLHPDTIYCGTGEANSLRSYYPGTGVYKSTDGGQSWVSVGLEDSYSIGRIAVDPSNPNVVYVAAVGSLRKPTPERGIYKTTDGGVSWMQSLFVADSVGAIDVAVDPVSPSRVFAAMWERTRREDYIKYGGALSALYLSTDGGNTWNVVGGGFPSNEPALGRISLDIARSDPNIIYALTAYASGSSRGLYRSTDGGTTWVLINSTVASSSSYAWFNRICRVHPYNPFIVYCGGLYMQKSANGGVSFSYLGESHVDQHAVDFSLSDSNRVVIGNDGGIDYSTNGGVGWRYSGSLPITQFYAGEISPHNPNIMLGGTQDNGTVRTLTGSLDDWVDIYGGDGFYCRIDVQNPNRVYASSQYGGLGYSLDGGWSFYDGTNGLNLTYTNWMTPYTMDKHTPLTLYAGTSVIYKSVNGMVSWTPISPDLSEPHVQLLGTITTIDVAYSDPQVIYCGTDNARVWVTTDGGGQWNEISGGLPSRWVTRVTIHPDSASVCYVTLSGYKIDTTGAHIYRTEDFGSSWRAIGGNLPDAPINDVLVDPQSSQRLYIASDMGVFYTDNQGEVWLPLGSGFPTEMPCHDLTLHETSRRLVVWTHGRSAWSVTLHDLVDVTSRSHRAPDGIEFVTNYPNPFNPTTTIRYRLGSASEVSIVIYNVLGQKIRTLTHGVRQTEGLHTIVWDGRHSDGRAVGSGTYFCRIATHAGYSRTMRMSLTK